MNQYKFFNLSQFVDFFVFAANKKIFLAPSIFSSSPFFSLSPLYLPHLLFPPCSPISQSLFFLSQCLHVSCEPWTTYLWFSFGFMSWCLTIEPWRLGCKFHYFFNTYTVEVINFPKLFTSDIVINENIPSIITHYYSKCTSALTIYKLILL